MVSVRVQCESYVHSNDSSLTKIVDDISMIVDDRISTNMQMIEEDLNDDNVSASNHYHRNDDNFYVCETCHYLMFRVLDNENFVMFHLLIVAMLD